MEELLYYIEVLKDIEDFVIRVNSDAGAENIGTLYLKMHLQS